MSKKTPADYLRDIINELDDIADFTHEGKEAFLNDIKTRKAVIRSYEIVGEIAKRLPETLHESNTQINCLPCTLPFKPFLIAWPTTAEAIEE